MHFAKKTPYAAGFGVHKASIGFKNKKRRSSISVSVIHLSAHSPASNWNATKFCPHGQNLSLLHIANVRIRYTSWSVNVQRSFFSFFTNRLIAVKYSHLSKSIFDTNINNTTSYLRCQIFMEENFWSVFSNVSQKICKKQRHVI